MTDGQARTRREALRAGAGALAGITFLDLDAVDDSETVRANVGYSEASGVAAVERHATELVWEFAFDAVTAMLPADALSTLAGRPDVRYVERDPRIEAIGVGDGGATVPWGVDRVDAEVAHAEGRTGDGAHVAIIDTGIDLTHTDLTANLGPGVTTIAGVTVSGGQDDNGHGTHCAGTAAAAGNNDRGVVGVAPDATVHPVKAITATGAGLTSDAAAGLEYVADQGWDVASMSIGGNRSTVMVDACDYAHERGVLIVAASGNDGGDIGHPASHPNVVSVGATNRNDDIAAFSSGGSAVDVLAPGVQVYSTYLGGYATLDGTSMAAPHVAGVGALLAPDGTAGDIATDGQGILDAASSVGLSSGDDGTGSGSSGFGGSGFGVDVVGL